MINKTHNARQDIRDGQSKVTIDDETGAITIDLVAYGPVRIVMTADGDIEVEGRSILNTVHWTSELASLPGRA